MARADIRRAGVYILAVNLVGEKVKIVFFHQVAYLVHLPAGVEIARRVVRVAYHYGTCVLVDKLLEFLNFRQRESLLNGCRDGAYLRSGRYCERHVVGVCRLWNYYLVARIEARHECEQYSFRSARRYYNVISIYVDVVFLIIFCKFLSVRLYALRRRILQHSAVDMFQRVQSHLRCGQVRLSYIQMIDLYAAFLRVVGKRCELPYRRFGHFKSAG